MYLLHVIQTHTVYVDVKMCFVLSALTLVVGQHSVCKTPALQISKFALGREIRTNLSNCGKPGHLNKNRK